MSSKSLPNLSISVQQSSWEGNTDGGEQGSTNEALSHLRTAGEEELFRGNLPAFVNTDLKQWIYFHIHWIIKIREIQN